MNDKLDKKENIKEREVSFGEKISLKFRKGFIGNKTKTILLVLIILLAFISINMWAQKQDLAQLDITENKIYTLTQTSKDAIKDITDEVNIYVYGYDENHAYVTFLKQYCAYNSNIKCEIVTETTHYDIVTTYEMGANNQIVVVCNDKDVILYPDYTFQTSEYVDGAYQDTDITEQSITNAIVKVTSKDIAKVYFINGHGEYTNSEITMLLSALDVSVYEYEFINLLTTTQIPEDCDVLAILAPRTDYSTQEAEMIKKYINNGGKIFLGMTTLDKNTDFANLQTVLDMFGVKFEEGIIYEGNTSNAVSLQGTTVPIVLIPNYSSLSNITKDINQTAIFSVVQALSVDYTKLEELNTTTNELLYTSTKAYNVVNYSNGFDLNGLSPDTYIFARKMIKTIPPVEGEEIKTAEMVVIGNDTFLSDYDSLIGDYPIGYQGNYEFTMNCFADLTNKESNIEILKDVTLTTFTSTARQDSVVQLIVFGIPVLIILAGIIIGTIRKRMR